MYIFITTVEDIMAFTKEDKDVHNVQTVILLLGI